MVRLTLESNVHQHRVCVVCHGQFTPRTSKQVTCTNRCYMWNQTHPGDSDRPRACDICGDPLPSGAHRARRHCPSVACQREALNAARRRRLGRRALTEVRHCGHCGAEIDKPKKGKRFCSARCLARESRFPGSWPYFRDRRCERCDAPVPVEMKREARFCSTRCQNRANGMARRSRHAGAAVERFSRSDVYERDRWVCHICRRPVDRALQWPDPWCASLDHVIPLNEPGSPGHVFANVACSHLFCNHSKNARTRHEDRAFYVAIDAGFVPEFDKLF